MRVAAFVEESQIEEGHKPHRHSPIYGFCRYTTRLHNAFRSFRHQALHRDLPEEGCFVYVFLLFIHIEDRMGIWLWARGSLFVVFGYERGGHYGWKEAEQQLGRDGLMLELNFGDI